MADTDELISYFQNQVLHRWRYRGLGHLATAALEGHEGRNEAVTQLAEECLAVSRRDLALATPQERAYLQELVHRGVQRPDEQRWVIEFHKNRKILDLFWKRAK
jgi:hypothetical protein